ncbi:hypothetical protein JAB5_42960 [Janthinobacterium sp. HH103]|nr:hypothetical protein JAB2_52550 [Janthinobacterium sp. HH100]OEZ70686.1 hypothetical protein JAB5_42960 [Janthinobacterium sp. HH103]QOU70894.1 hypothetical protein JAB4_002870 [Janthinobacterium sp. HH102]
MKNSSPGLVGIPAPHRHGTFDQEPFADYMRRWPVHFAHVPEAVIETWIYRHWNDFQAWLPMEPLSWEYAVVSMSNEEILSIGHVSDWPKTLRGWGDDLFDGKHRLNTWLGRYMLASGTMPAPIIVAVNAGSHVHPREHEKMRAPYQLIEGHLRLAYLQAMIRRKHESLQLSHTVVIATFPAMQVR